jgi:hypothetical protein
MWMLDEEQSVAAVPGLPGPYKLLLDLERVRVSHASEIKNFERSHILTDQPSAFSPGLSSPPVANC